MKASIQLIVNGKSQELSVDTRRLLVDVLRDDLGLTGTKKGCGSGDCGACTVLINGSQVNSCLILAVEADGQEIMTIEGLQNGLELNDIQRAFINHGAVQCGYCTSGMILSAKALLDRNPHPTVEDAKVAISGNLCRCTGYQKIIEAITSLGQKE